MSFPFSNRTLAHLARSIERSHSHTTMEVLFYEFSLTEWEDPSATNKLAKAMNLLKAMQSDASPTACRGAKDLMTETLKAGKPSHWGDDAAVWYEPLLGALLADGFEFDESMDTLVPSVKGLAVAPEVSWLEAELARRGWRDAQGHYEQALDNFGQGNWAAASSQLRSLYEDVIRRAGGTIDKNGSGQVQAAADALKDQPDVLLPNEDQYIKALWGVLHKHGPHPGLGDEDLARFRLLAITGHLRALLSRLADTGATF
ncbi:MAG: hypothetical protein F4121_04810 [Acidimicrobiia bacterium]|nr:hypothetical protein [Acidimicrobiia bacterium]MYC46362.1 hypothetical protein [Acidimicrobiia bacterium]MYI19414.1 hypothetical protein [Acidimicrobiia bacterium]